MSGADTRDTRRIDSEDLRKCSEILIRRSAHGQYTCSCGTNTKEGIYVAVVNFERGMGGSDSKLNFRKAVVQLTTKKTVGIVFVSVVFMAVVDERERRSYDMAAASR